MAVESMNEIFEHWQAVHGELPFRLPLAVQTIRGNGSANGNSQGRLPVRGEFVNQGFGMVKAGLVAHENQLHAALL